MADKEEKADVLALIDELGNPIDDNTPIGDDEDLDLHVAGVTTPDSTPAEDDDAMKAFKASFEQIKTQNAELQKRVKDADDRETAQRATTLQTQQELLTHALAGSKMDLQTAQSNYAKALEENRFEDVATLQTQIAQAVVDIRDYEQAIEEFKRTPVVERKPDPTPAGSTPPAAVPHAEAVDNFIAGMRPNTRALATRYKDQIFPDGDSKPLAKVLAIEQFARARGLEVDSPAYVAFIEKQMLGDGEFKASGEPAIQPKARPAPQNRRPPMPSAPANNGNGGNSNQVILSKAEQRMARSMNMTNQAYAAHKKTVLDNTNNPEYTGPRYSRDDPANNRR